MRRTVLPLEGADNMRKTHAQIKPNNTLLLLQNSPDVNPSPTHGSLLSCACAFRSSVRNAENLWKVGNTPYLLLTGLLSKLCVIVWLAAWRSGNGVGCINKVTLRRAWLVLGWVTCPGSTPGGGTLFRYVTSQPGRLSLSSFEVDKLSSKL